MNQFYRYTYCHNNPYKYDDPSGQLPDAGLIKYTAHAIKDDGGSSYTPPIKKTVQSQKSTVVKAVVKTDDPPAETSPQSKASNKTPSIEESPDSDDDPDIPEVDASRVKSPLDLLIDHKNQFIKSQVIMKDGPIITDDKNDDTQNVTGNIETENVGTEAGINGDSNTGSSAKDIFSEINYYGLYNDLVEGAGEEMYSRAGNTFLKTVNSSSNASSKVVKEMYNGTIKSGAQYAGDAFDTMLRALDDLETITKVSGLATTGLEFVLEYQEGISEGKKQEESMIESAIIVGTSSLAGYIASQVTVAFLGLISVTSPLSVVLLPAVVAAVSGTIVGKIVEEKIEGKSNTDKNTYVNDKNNKYTGLSD